MERLTSSALDHLNYSLYLDQNQNTVRKLSLILPAVLFVLSCTRTNSGTPQPQPNPSSEYVVSTYAVFPGQYDLPIGVAEDPSGNLYACDAENDTIWKIATDSTISPIATIGSRMSDIACDAMGNIYVLAVDQRKILLITPAGVVTTFAGGASSQVDGQGSAAGFSGPGALDIDSSGTLYVADGRSIRKVDQAGRVTTLYTDTTAKFPMVAITFDPHHNIYYATGNQIWRLDTLGNRTFIAGQQGVQNSLDGTGSAAGFNEVDELRMDKNGNLWATDYSEVRLITPAGVVTTIAGNHNLGSTDGDGDVAKFDFPTGLVIDPNGTVFVADDVNNKIRKIVHK
jgi:sugar lactone lactonase YvrE